MLTITIPSIEQWSSSEEEFSWTKPHSLQLEHSLVSLSKWESRWHKPFLTREPKPIAESLDYIRCMTVTQNVEPEWYNLLTMEHFKIVDRYIAEPMTATRISKINKSPNRDVITAELIYYWMVSFNIPFECQKWHLNRLLTLIEVCNEKSQDPKKIPQKELMSRNAALNAARKQKYNTKG